ncbi:MAG: methyltransferase, partial [Cyclobacteriaceae bacterium]|nr:methyltransferase [Cyclobacteriaceae bacterium]
MEIVNPLINRYSEVHTSSESDLLKRIDRQTHANILMPRMLSGHLQGRLLSMISHMIQPKSIL